MNSFQSALKRAIDLSLSSLALLVFSPIYLVIVISIRLDSKGPAIFRQRRLGMRGRSFNCLKFRTMRVDAPDIRNADGSTFNSEDDPRVTRVGALLRKTSLDELPQLINVIVGHMSLVGPRPDQVDQIRFYSPRDMLRLMVKPGLTGLAQINGRNSIPWDERKRLDLEYVERRSILLDLRILAQTIPYVLVRRDVFVKQVASEAQQSSR